MARWLFQGVLVCMPFVEISLCYRHSANNTVTELDSPIATLRGAANKLITVLGVLSNYEVSVLEVVVHGHASCATRKDILV